MASSDIIKEEFELIEYFVPRNFHHTELYIIHYGSQICSPGHYYGPAVRDHYLLHYILDGQGIFKTAEQTYELNAGQAFLIYPDAVTYYKADLDNPWTYCWVGFNGLNAENLLLMSGFLPSQPILTDDEQRSVGRCMQSLINMHPQGKARDLHLTAKIYQLMAALVENNRQDEVIPAQSRHQQYVEEVVRFIELNFANKITVSDIARNIGLNRSYLNALFKEQMQTNIQDYLIRYRVERALRLMINEALSIGDIARSVGYDDPLLFSKIFKKITGSPPSHYRKQLLSNPPPESPSPADDRR